MRSSRSVRIGLAAAVALAALSGCANAEPGVAAYVDSTKITESQLDAAVTGVESTLDEGQQVSKPGVLNAMIQGAMADELASENNLVITDSERDTLLLSSQGFAGLLDVPAAKQLAYDLADTQIVSDKLGPEKVAAGLAERKVTLNPRYGVLDPAQKIITTADSGSLAKPGSGVTTPDIPQ